MADAVTIKTLGLDQLLKALKAKPPVARVGILGDKNARNDKTTNAAVGAAHEYGTVHLPQRSFLRVPLTDNLGKAIEDSGQLNKEVMAEVLKVGSVVPWLKKVAVLAEGIVQGAFDSRGYGKWQGYKNQNYENNTGLMLVDTQQLRRSITSEVKE